MSSHGRRTIKAREGIDREKLYPLDQAVQDGQGARQGEVR